MYVERKLGTIVGAYVNPQAGYAEELVADNSPELVAFLAGPTDAEKRLAVATSSKSVLNGPGEHAVVNRALAALLLSEINALRSWITDFKAAVAGAASLANLKTAVAALPKMPDRTRTQAIQAILNNCDTEAQI